jgi:hypothetical protein
LTVLLQFVTVRVILTTGHASGVNFLVTTFLVTSSHGRFYRKQKAYGTFCGWLVLWCAVREVACCLLIRQSLWLQGCVNCLTMKPGTDTLYLWAKSTCANWLG